MLVGDGPMRGELQRQIASAGLSDRVHLCGSVDDAQLHGWYEAATLFVHPTLYEGSSLVTLEAMAHRRAVIATRAGGFPDKVISGVNGWLVEPGDSQALAAAIREALSNTSRLDKMGSESRAIVEREFSWAVATDRLSRCIVTSSRRTVPPHAMRWSASSHPICLTPACAPHWPRSTGPARPTRGSRDRMGRNTSVACSR